MNQRQDFERARGRKAQGGQVLHPRGRHLLRHHRRPLHGPRLVSERRLRSSLHQQPRSSSRRLTPCHRLFSHSPSQQRPTRLNWSLSLPLPLSLFLPLSPALSLSVSLSLPLSVYLSLAACDSENCRRRCRSGMADARRLHQHWLLLRRRPSAGLPARIIL